MKSRIASVAEWVTARALAEQPKMRVITGSQRDVSRALVDDCKNDEEKAGSALCVRTEFVRSKRVGSSRARMRSR
jgi:hypothetical protein